MMDVCLVAVPYMPLQRPSIALSILKASLANVGIDTGVLYTNIEFAERIGIENYWFISTFSHLDLLGEWLFSRKAFPDFHSNEDVYFETAENILREVVDNDRLLNFYLKGQSIHSYFTGLRSIAATFIDDMAANIVAHAPRIVGCSSTFQEHCPGLALLKKVHDLNPDIITMMGGANCEGTMGQVTHKNFLFVDYVVSGEAEILLPELCQKILVSGHNIPDSLLPLGVLGPMSRQSSKPMRTIGRAVVQDFNKSPIPDFSDYFEQIGKSSIQEYLSQALAIETSRGCWWGDKHQCTFCGLNGSDAMFRYKSAQRVQHELEIQTGKYGITNYLSADNILGLSYFKDLIPSLAKNTTKYSLFFEIKSNLSRKQMQMLKEAGVDCAQPGIENLHTELLKLINKGVTAKQNIEILKWGLEYKIDIFWFLLLDIPGGQEAWYNEVAEIIPLIAHLQPPMRVNWVEYCRFSPYHNEQNRFGLNLAPYPCYTFIYPMSKEDIFDFAYLFIDLNDTEKKQRHSEVMKKLKSNAMAWQCNWDYSANHPKTELTMAADDDALQIIDTRPCAVQKHIVLTGLPKRVYEICDTSALPQKIHETLNNEGYMDITPAQLDIELGTLIDMKIMLKVDDHYLSLAVRKHPELSYAKFPSGCIEYSKIHSKFFVKPDQEPANKAI
ncbi:MAG: RiPP maturation radical SAM protein 1 [Methylococcaceae bacterium]|nr:MAG: RiPP maturation radical SAM protein 1 [Methylococcaceae bacterium]